MSLRRLIPMLAAVAACIASVHPAPIPPLSTLHSIHILSNDEASRGLPVAFEATVTYFRGSERMLFVQDGDLAIYVSANTNAKLIPGDRVLVVGKTHADFGPDVMSDRVTLLRHGDLPKPVPATFDDLIRIQRDCMLVTVQGVVHTVDLDPRADTRDARLPMHTIARVQLLMEGGYIEAFIDSDDANAVSGLLDAEVEITGTAGSSFNGKMEPTGAQLYVSTLANVKILKRAEASPWSRAVTPMNRVVTGYHVSDLTQRIRIHGTITYYQSGSAIVLQSGPTSMWIATQTRMPMQVGDVADAIGFPDVHNGVLALAHAEIQDTHVQAPIQPLPVTWKQLTASGNLFDLVSIEGQVVRTIREASQDEYVLASNGQLFTAIYRHQPGYSVLPPMKQIALGSRVRVGGICILEDSNPFNGEVPFDILLRNFDDIAVLSRPSLLNIRNLMLLVGLLLAVVIAVGARAWYIERRVRRQTAALGSIELRRSRILEAINGSRPLAEILEEITELVSFKLRGAPCWCQIADGAQLGNCPPKLTGLRIVHSEIPSHSGSALGTISAAFDRRAKPSANELEALSMAVALIALAVETRRLYTDLLHRSEFDLLTDIHNRFSLDRYMDRQIGEARQNAGLFGLIYIDLDKFKQVNDVYGHPAGDIYLQEAAVRMKRQLRPGDMLARLGGDEFAVLVPGVRNRAVVEDIALRLRFCFDDPFALEGKLIEGSASIGVALYPEDATTKDGLLNAADSAMYASKQSRSRNRATASQR
jgi:diguanylate cyclase (GGDEF)-like protein